MKCWSCRKKGIDSTMVRENGYAYCPRCGREITYKTEWDRKNEENSPGFLKIVLYIFLAILVIFGLIAANPWLLLVLLIPVIILVVWISKKYDNDDDEDE